jgi:hypothetical protein
LQCLTRRSGWMSEILTYTIQPASLSRGIGHNTYLLFILEPSLSRNSMIQRRPSTSSMTGRISHLHERPFCTPRRLLNASTIACPSNSHSPVSRTTIRCLCHPPEPH